MNIDKKSQANKKRIEKNGEKELQYRTNCDRAARSGIVLRTNKIRKWLKNAEVITAYIEPGYLGRTDFVKVSMPE